ncbi:MAG: methyltransferase domain-containing protein [Rhodospirillales bacterium]|nr:methyltransferase domain-containing protein [Rhodospirillales bacterium]
MAPNNTPSPADRQTWNPERYARNAGFVAELGEPVLDLLAPVSGEKILDLGCGDGVLTEKIAAAGADVTGVDASPQQVAAVRAKGLQARVINGQELDFEAAFEAVFSNAALHWMTNPDAVLAGVFRALKPGGRFVGEMGGEGNVQAIARALADGLDQRGLDAADVNPWYFPGPQEYREKLEKAGFRVRSIDLIPRPTPLPGDIEGWLETFAESFLKRVADDQKDSYIADVRDALAPLLCDPEGNWTADYVRLRFAADKPEAI